MKWKTNLASLPLTDIGRLPVYQCKKTETECNIIATEAILKQYNVYIDCQYCNIMHLLVLVNGKLAFNMFEWVV